MSKKYLSLDEAASLLGMPREELSRLREKGDIRGFSDRGTWKFNSEDVESLARSRQADSDPDVPMMFGGADSSDSIHIEDDEIPGLFDDIAMESDAPADSSVDRDLLGTSDSDVRLILDEELTDTGSNNLVGSDSDVSLVGDQSESEFNLLGGTSDSDVHLIGDSSDSDVKLVDDAEPPVTPNEATAPEFDFLAAQDEDEAPLFVESVSDETSPPVLQDSDSDVKLALPSDSEDALVLDSSDSDVQLLPESESAGHASDSDVAILGADSGVSLNFDDSNSADDFFTDEIALSPSDSGVAQANDSGIQLNLDDDDESITLASPSSGVNQTGSGGSGISLAADSGISLAGSDSAIAMSGLDSGISLSAADSGISLDAVADSGISLEDSHDDYTGTIPMMNVVSDDELAPTTKFEMPEIDEDSAFELEKPAGKGKATKASKAKTEDTGVLDLSSDDDSFEDAVFDVDEESSEGDDDYGDLDVADDVVGEDDEVDDLDVFDADEAFGDEDDEELAPVMRGGRVPVASEQSWGTGLVVGLGLSSILMLASCWIMVDLVRSMWLWGDRATEPGLILGLVSKMFAN